MVKVLHLPTHLLDLALQVHLLFVEQLVQLRHLLLHLEVKALLVLRFVIYEFSFQLRIVLHYFHFFVEQHFLVSFDLSLAFFSDCVDLFLGLLLELAHLLIEGLDQLVVGVWCDAEFLLDLVVEETTLVVLIKSIPDFVRSLFNNLHFLNDRFDVHFVEGYADVAHLSQFSELTNLHSMLLVLSLEGHQRHFILIPDGFNLPVEDVPHVLTDQVSGVEELYFDVLVALEMRMLAHSYPKLVVQVRDLLHVVHPHLVDEISGSLQLLS